MIAASRSSLDGRWVWPVQAANTTRVEMLANGRLIETPAGDRGAFFNCPVAISRAVWDSVVSHPVAPDQWDDRRRLLGLLAAAKSVAQKVAQTSFLTFTLHCVPVGSIFGRGEYVVLFLHVGPGDDGWNVITIMYPSEAG